jgi:hypothetical protein
VSCAVMDSGREGGKEEGGERRLMWELIMVSVAKSKGEGPASVPEVL